MTTATTTGTTPRADWRGRRAAAFAAMLALLAGVSVLSIAFGSNPLSVAEVWHGATHPGDGSDAASIVWTMRGPRTLIGLLVGAACGMAGALIQALTRNPLADPGILGVNAGAAFAVTVGVGVLGVTSISGYVWFAFVGAAVATVLVHLVGSVGRGTVSPPTLVLAGVALSAVLIGISTMLTLLDRETFETLRTWGLGSIARTTTVDVLVVAPLLIAGMGLALALTGPLNSVALGDDFAAALGVRVGVVRVLGVVAITVLAGGATALTGGIAFVGLMVPHIARWLVGPDQRWIMLCSAPGGALLVVAADVLGRVIARPGEIEVGIVTAIVGAPVLIALVRRRTASGL